MQAYLEKPSLGLGPTPEGSIRVALLRLMDIVDGSVPSKSFVHGRILDKHSRTLIRIPAELKHGASATLKLASTAAKEVFKVTSIDGIRY